MVVAKVAAEPTLATSLVDSSEAVDPESMQVEDLTHRVVSCLEVFAIW